MQAVFLFLKRFWPGLLIGCLTFILLNWLLEPRPLWIQSVPHDNPASVYDYRLSPDGKYLATRATGVISGHGGCYSDITLWELPTMRKVFSDMSYIDDFQFDSHSSLVYVVTERHRGEGKGNLKQLKRCRSGEEKSQIIWEREEAPVSADNDSPQSADKTVHYVFKLSPDARTLFIACIILDQMQMELIDTAIGTVRGKCSIPCVVNQDGIFGVQSVFTSDSKNIVIEAEQTEKQASHHYWCWVDVQSGQQVKKLKVPDGMRRNSFIDATSNTPIGLTTVGITQVKSNEPTQSMVLSGSDQIQQIRLSEIEPPDVSAGEMAKLCINMRSFCIPEEHLLVYCWLFFTDPEFNNGEFRFFHTQSWAIRNLMTGELVHKGTLPPFAKSTEAAEREYNQLIAFLPGRYLMFEQYNLSKPSYFEELLAKLHSWLGSKYEKLTKLIIVDGKSSDVTNTLSLPGVGFHTLLLESGTKLLLINNHKDKFNVRMYDFPLHQPWFIITAWALGAGMAITLLQELARWRRRRRLAHIVQK